MKIILLTIVLFAGILFTGCKKEDNKACYIFTVTSTIDIVPSQPGYPRSNVVEDEDCEITEDEAIEINNSYYSYDTDTLGNYTFITTVNSTYRKK